MEMTDKNLKMRNDIMDVIHESGINFKCSGYQSEQDSDLSLEEWTLDDPDAVVNQILGIVSDYIQEML